MHSKFPFALLGASMLLLASCGGNNAVSSSDSPKPDESSSEPSSSSDAPKGEKLTVNEAASLLESLAQSEASSSSGYHAVEKNTVSGSLTQREENGTLYSDGSSSYLGSVTRGEQSDAFKGRKLKREDSFLNAGVSSTRERLYWVEEHQNAFATDETTFCNVYEIQDEDDGSGNAYIPTDSVSFTLTGMVSGVVHDFLAAVSEDTYLLSAMPYFYKTEEDGVTYYQFDASYSYSGDLNDTVQMTYSIAFSVENNLLQSASYLSEMSDSREGEEAYVKTASYEGSLTYGERGALPNDGLLNVDDYLLSDVTEIQIHSSGAGGEVLNGNIPTSSYYISASPSLYSPEKAITGLLTPISSTDDTILKVTSGSAIEVKQKSGTATITFSYLGRDENGVFLTKTIQKELTVAGTAPKSFRVSEDELIGDRTLVVGETYENQLIFGKGDSTLEIEVSDPEALEASLSSKGNLLLTPKKEASSVTVTLTPVAAPELAKTLTYSIEAKKDSREVLLSRDFTYVNHLVIGTAYQHFTLHFDSNGTGYRYLTIDGQTDTYKDPFTWTLNEGRVEFTWDESVENFHLYEYAEIRGNGRFLHCYEKDTSDESSSTPNDTLYQGKEAQ